MDSSKLLNNRYLIRNEIGCGGFGLVYKAHDFHKNIEVALKIDLQPKGSIYEEAMILKDLQGGEGIPKLYDYGRINSYNYMAMQLLGPNLSTYSASLPSCSLNAITSILLQGISRIEYIHSKGYVHRDIKPQQFLIGPHSILYLVDYGISKRYMSEHLHISFQSNCPRSGSCSFASINCHIGVRLSRRDDFESLVYTAIYLIKKCLPWTLSKGIKDISKWNIVLQLKRDTSEKELFKGCPEELVTFFRYIKNLKFEDKPDYEYLKRIVVGIRERSGLTGSLMKLKLDWEDEKKMKGKKRKVNTLIHKKTIEEDKKGNERKAKSPPKRSDTKSSTVISVRKKSIKVKQFDELKAPGQESMFSIDVLSSSTKPQTKNEDTAKGIYPEFRNREKIFTNLKAFRTQYYSS